MRVAIVRVLTTTEQIAQIAFALGYEHPTQFAREFAGMFGCSPTALRELFADAEAITGIEQDVPSSNTSFRKRRCVRTKQR
jgi:AraC-like DNA-binding protein